MAQCTSCKDRAAIFMRSYSGEKLCRRCFTKSIERKVQATISKYDMLKRDDALAVAISGGKDSTSLLHILMKIEKEFPEARLAAVTVDEGIKGYRDEALRFAIKNCQKFGVEHNVISFTELFGYSLDELVDMIRRKGENELTPGAYCGVLRRRALNSAARKMGASKLATAHNLDDETQTILLNIMHGDVTKIARAKPVLSVAHPKLIQRIKPFCEVPEREITFYAYLKNIEFQESPCPYAHTALRNDVRSMLNRIEQSHAGTKFTIFRSIERIRPALEAMDKEEKLHTCKLCGEPTMGEVCRPCQMLQRIDIP